MQSMEIYEIICGALVLLLSLLIIILCMMQDTKTQQNMTSAITGGSNDSFYGKNEGRTREAMLGKLTRNLGIVVFVLIAAMNLVIPTVSALMKSDGGSDTTTPTTSTSTSAPADTTAATGADTTADTAAATNADTTAATAADTTAAAE